MDKACLDHIHPPSLPSNSSQWTPNPSTKVCVLLFRKKLTHWFQPALPIFARVYGHLLPRTMLLKMPVSAFPSHHQLWIGPELGVGVPVCYPFMLGCLLSWPCRPWVHKCICFYHIWKTLLLSSSLTSSKLPTLWSGNFLETLGNSVWYRCLIYNRTVLKHLVSVFWSFVSIY